jgi:DNA-binding IclR family transcriptional regulator
VQNESVPPFSVSREPRRRPPYAVASVDNALRIATWLQMEGSLTVSEAAARLAVAPSTASRLLQMLVYRDFAVRDDGRAYRAGPVLELAGNSPSLTARLRAASLGPLRDLVRASGESANLNIRTGDRVRFIASVEGDAPLCIPSREGMVFPVERTSGGTAMLAALSDEEVTEILDGRPAADVDTVLSRLRMVRRSGVAVNLGRSEEGLVAIGRTVVLDGEPVAAVSIAMPAARYFAQRLPEYDAWLRRAVEALEAALQPDS